MENLTPLEQEVLSELRSNAERDSFRAGWMTVPIFNCIGYGTHQFSGVLSSLEKKGLYIPYHDGENDGNWGDVKSK